MKRDPFRKIAALAAILSLVLSSFIAVGGVTAQAGTSNFVVTSATLTCAEPGDVTAVLELAWTGSSALVNAEISISNTSTDWSDTMLTSDADGVTWEFDHHKIDRVVVDATMADGSTWQYQATFFDCGEANPFGEMLTPPTDGSLYFLVTDVMFCGGGYTELTVDTNQSGEATITTMRAGNSWEMVLSWEYTRSFAINGSGTYSATFPPNVGRGFNVDFGGKTVLSDAVSSYEADCDGIPIRYASAYASPVSENGVCGHGSLTVRTSIPIRVEVVTGLEDGLREVRTVLEVQPTGDPGIIIPFYFDALSSNDTYYLQSSVWVYDLQTGELIHADRGQLLESQRHCSAFAPLDTDYNIEVKLPEGVSVVGSPFGVYTAEAATLPTGAYYTGIVGANNTITLPDFLPGEYRIVIAPVDGDLISFDVTLGEGDTSLVVDLTVDDEVTTPDDTDTGTTPEDTDPGTTPDETDPVTDPQAVAGQTSSETSGTAVDTLPSTGSGSGSDSSTSLIAAGSLIALLGMALALRAAGSDGYRR